MKNKLTFEEAFKIETNRLNNEIEKVSNKNYYNRGLELGERLAIIIKDLDYNNPNIKMRLTGIKILIQIDYTPNYCNSNNNRIDENHYKELLEIYKEIRKFYNLNNKIINDDKKYHDNPNFDHSNERYFCKGFLKAFFKIFGRYHDYIRYNLVDFIHVDAYNKFKIAIFTKSCYKEYGYSKMWSI